ncbi:MAG TPA: DNA polymerase, partial [Methylomirabilota bacterium]|nr:DNA polymerase [Methylomirabilota bacterium]
MSTRVPIEQDLEAFRRQEPDWERLRTLWTELEFHTLLRQLPAAAPVQVTGEPMPVLDGAEALRQWLEAVPADAPVAVDWVGDGTSPDPSMTALGLYHPAAERALLPLGASLPDFGGRRLIGHDVKHLVEWWAARGGDAPAFEDTAVGAYLLNPDRNNYKLDEVSAELLGEGPGLAAPGSRGRFIWQIWEMLPRALKEVGLHSLYEDLERPLVPVLAAMERHGIRVDPARLAEFSKELDLTIERLTREIYALAGEEFNIGSPKQMARILFEKLKLPPVKKTKTGYSTDADVLEQLAFGHELPAKIIEYRTLAKLKSTYADSLPALINPGTERIHTSFNQLVAATGRLSSSNPNVQNIPIRTELGRRIRAAFVPDPGYRFVAADYSQIELRILAHVSGEESLIAAFHAGEDIHRRTAAEVFGVELAQVTSDQRDVAKTTNFSVIYGVTAFGLSRGLS